MYVVESICLHTAACMQGLHSDCDSGMRLSGRSEEDLVEWISVIEECDDEVLRMSSLPALQGILSKAEKLAGRIVANEIAASLSGQDSTGGDRVGRERLIKLCEPPSYQM